MSTEVIGYIGQINQKPTQTKQESTQQARTAHKDKLYYIKQKAVGVILIGLGAISAVISEGDITFLIFMLFFAVPLFGKNKVLMIEEDDAE